MLEGLLVACEMLGLQSYIRDVCSLQCLLIDDVLTLIVYAMDKYLTVSALVNVEGLVPSLCVFVAWDHFGSWLWLRILAYALNHHGGLFKRGGRFVQVKSCILALRLAQAFVYCCRPLSLYLPQGSDHLLLIALNLDRTLKVMI